MREPPPFAPRAPLRRRFLGVAAALLGAGAVERAAGAEAPATADALFDLTLEDGDGQRRALAQWRGRNLLVNFWATWCTPCVAEMPELDALQKETPPARLLVLGIGAENRAHLREFRDQHALRHMTLLAGGYDAIELARRLGNRQGVLPYTLLVSSAGKVLNSHVGALPPGSLHTWLRDLPS